MMRDEARKSDLLDLTVQLHHETAKAILVSDDGDKEHAVWLPLSQCEVERKAGGIIVVTLPEWLATDKGLV
jgi:hypothetical protein